MNAKTLAMIAAKLPLSEGVRKLNASNEDNPGPPLPRSEPQRHVAPALERAAAGEKKGVARPLVRFTGFRVRPVDPDSFAGSCKHLLDGIRHAGLILGDEPWRIVLQTEQVKVDTLSAERTVISIDYSHGT